MTKHINSFNMAQDQSGLEELSMKAPRLSLTLVNNLRQKIEDLS